MNYDPRLLDRIDICILDNIYHLIDEAITLYTSIYSHINFPLPHVVVSGSTGMYTGDNIRKLIHEL